MVALKIAKIIVRGDESRRVRLAVRFERGGAKFYRVLVTERGKFRDDWREYPEEDCEEVE